MSKQKMDKLNQEYGRLIELQSNLKALYNTRVLSDENNSMLIEAAMVIRSNATEITKAMTALRGES